MALERRAEEQQYRPTSRMKRESPMKPTREPCADRGWVADACGVDSLTEVGHEGQASHPA